MEQRWGFLAPWCAALGENRVAYKGEEFSAPPFTRRSLCVVLPTRQALGPNRSLSSHFDTEAKFLKRFQDAREAMALLAAVAHVDYDAWRYLLEKHCAVNFGAEGEAIYEEKIPVRYVVTVDQQPKTDILRDPRDLETHEYDLVFLCGPHQRLHPSAEYQETLQRIAALDQDPQRRESGFVFEVPVRVEFSVSDEENYADALADVATAEILVKEQWENYSASLENQAPAPGEWRCTLALERMIVNLSGIDMSNELTPPVKNLLYQNSWLSLLLMCFENDLMPSLESYGQLVSSVFSSTRRPPELANSTYHPAFNCTGDDSRPLQLGEIDITWITCLQLRDIGAMCSAMVHSQMSRKLSMRLWMDILEREKNQKYWQWLAYALFSKRARAYSSVESLEFMIVTSMSVADMEEFTSILESEHPEADLFDSPPGELKPKDATLRAGYLVRCVLSTPMHTQGKCHSSEPSAMTGGARGSRLLFLDAPKGDLTSILQCCPNLEEFALSGGVVDVRLDFSNYQAKGKSLPELRLNWDSISEFAAANDTALAKFARRVRVRVKHLTDEDEGFVRRGDHERDTLRDFSALLKMLEANKYLEFLEVVAHPDYGRYLQTFRAHHLKPIWRALNPLLLESKIAFLSISMPKTSPEKSKKRETQTAARTTKPLNQHVLTNIFEYAADPVLRQVYFRKSRRIKLDLLFDDALV